MMDYIIDKTDYHVKLISHVIDINMQETQYDPAVLEPLFAKYKNTDRVVYVDSETLNAKQIKGHIGSCDAFIGARTHSTIAAYSTCVPTVVIGYSIKSRGIAQDIFGTQADYVIPVGDVGGDILVQAVKRLITNNKALHAYLTQTMPEYKKSANQAAEALKEIIFEQ